MNTRTWMVSIERRTSAQVCMYVCQWSVVCVSVCGSSARLRLVTSIHGEHSLKYRSQFDSSCLVFSSFSIFFFCLCLDGFMCWPIIWQRLPATNNCERLFGSRDRSLDSLSPLFPLLFSPNIIDLPYMNAVHCCLLLLLLLLLLLQLQLPSLPASLPMNFSGFKRISTWLVHLLIHWMIH